MKRTIRACLVVAMISAAVASAASAQKPVATAEKLAWQPWSDQVFSEAKRTHRFVLDGSCVVPLVPRDGRQHLQRSESD